MAAPPKSAALVTPPNLAVAPNLAAVPKLEAVPNLLTLALLSIATASHA